MHLKYYTADAICQAMGLPGFIEESWMQRDGPTLRLLLKPSLHPELCLTLFREKVTTRLSVVALAESFWTQVAANRAEAVTFEVKRKRIFTQDAGGYLHVVKPPVPDLAAAHAETAAEEAAHVAHTLTDEEKAARVRVLKSAVQTDTEARRRYESEEERWIALTDEEKAVRVRAFVSAMPYFTEMRRRRGSEAARFWTREFAAHLVRKLTEEAVRTLTEEAEAARVRALKSAVPTYTEARRRIEREEGRWIEEKVHRIWKEERRHLARRDEVLLPSSAFDEVAKLFSEARATFDPRDIGLDCMSSESCLVSRASLHRLDARVSGVAMVAYVGKVIALAWSSCRCPLVRRALVEADGCIDMNIDHTLEEVGQQCSAARKRSRQIEAKALRKLKANALRELKRLRVRLETDADLARRRVSSMTEAA